MGSLLSLFKKVRNGICIQIKMWFMPKIHEFESCWRRLKVWTIPDTTLHCTKGVWLGCIWIKSAFALSHICVLKSEYLAVPAERTVTQVPKLRSGCPYYKCLKWDVRLRFAGDVEDKWWLSLFQAPSSILSSLKQNKHLAKLYKYSSRIRQGIPCRAPGV